MVVFLELFWHIVRNLANSVQRSIPNFWIWMATMLDQNWNHHSNFRRLIHVLTNLTECHQTCMFVAPVTIVLDCIYDKLTNQRQHQFLTNR